MRTALGLGLVFLGGAIAGAGLAINELEREFDKQYLNDVETMRRVFERRNEGITPTAPVEDEHQLTIDDIEPVSVGPVEEPSRPEQTAHIMDQIVPIELTGEPEVFTGRVETRHQALNPYHTPVSATAPEEPEGLFEVESITEEEYDDDDGRYKAQIIMVVDGTADPMFFQDGRQIDDWEQKVGEGVIRDFYSKLQPGEPPVLYYRNHRSDEDFEVVRQLP